MTALRFHGDPPTHCVSPLLEEAGVPHLFTTRNFPGVTAFREPFPPLGPEAHPLLAGRGLGTEPAAFLKQVHGADVIRATQGGCVGNADVVMTDRPGLPIAVFSADCVPLLIYDPDGRRLAAAHAGWRGTAWLVARAAVEALVEAGGRPEGFLAAVGPSPRRHERQDGRPRHGLGGAAPARVDDREPPPGGVVDQERHAVGGKDRDGQPRPVSHESVRVPRQATLGRTKDIGAVDLLEEGHGLHSEAALGEQGRGVLTERREWVPEGRHAREVARGEQVGHPRLFEQRRNEVRRRVAVEARGGHGVGHCLTRSHAAPVWPTPA